MWKPFQVLIMSVEVALEEVARYVTQADFADLKGHAFCNLNCRYGYAAPPPGAVPCEP
jgi:hypothetical protein